MNLNRFVVGVVDDDPRVLESCEELLASEGYQSLLFPSAQAFIDSGGFRQVDCLISDIGMPAMSGWQLLEIAHAQRPGLPVILITARDGDHTRAALEAKGARYLFKKPFSAPELLAAIDSIRRLGQLAERKTDE